MQMCIVEKAVGVTSITQAAMRPISMRPFAELFLAATIGVRRIASLSSISEAF